MTDTVAASDLKPSRCGGDKAKVPLRLLNQLEDALEDCTKLARAFELMALGLREFSESDGLAVLGMAELLMKRLKRANTANLALRKSVTVEGPP